jgi:hypothetical protein
MKCIRSGLIIVACALFASSAFAASRSESALRAKVRRAAVKATGDKAGGKIVVSLGKDHGDSVIYQWFHLRVNRFGLPEPDKVEQGLIHRETAKMRTLYFSHDFPNEGLLDLPDDYK